MPSTKAKILNLSLVLTSLIGYLEWGEDKTAFLFQVEAVILSKLFQDPASIVHPFVLLPLAGQLLLLFTLFQKQPGKALTFSGLGGIGVLLLLMFAIGVMNLNVKIFASTLPFLVTGILTIRHHRKENVHV